MTTGRQVPSQLHALLWQEEGQDMVEYALLCAFIAFAGLAAWQAIEGALGASYRSYDTAQQELWEPPDPAGS